MKGMLADAGEILHSGYEMSARWGKSVEPWEIAAQALMSKEIK